MRSRQRLYASIEPDHKVGKRDLRFRRLDDDGADRSEHVLYTMVKFGVKYALLFVGAFARGDININAYGPQGPAVTCVPHEHPRLDPANLVSWAKDSIFATVFWPPFPMGAAAKCFPSYAVLGVYTCLPF